MKYDDTKMYSYKYTNKELAFKLFRKKKCPVCGRKLVHFTTEFYVGRKRFNSVVTQGYGGERDDYLRKDWYKCNTCNKEYSLQDLMLVNHEK